jgi:hypothetical protein
MRSPGSKMEIDTIQVEVEHDWPHMYLPYVRNEMPPAFLIRQGDEVVSMTVERLRAILNWMEAGGWKPIIE